MRVVKCSGSEVSKDATNSPDEKRRMFLLKGNELEFTKTPRQKLQNIQEEVQACLYKISDVKTISHTLRRVSVLLSLVGGKQQDFHTDYRSFKCFDETTEEIPYLIFISLEAKGSKVGCFYASEDDDSRGYLVTTSQKSSLQWVLFSLRDTISCTVAWVSILIIFVCIFMSIL
jgi:hypothetical protein